jgi:hypothetical protein
LLLEPGTATHNNDKRLRDIPLVEVELEEITNALQAFNSEVATGASVGAIPGRLIKKDGS